MGTDLFVFYTVAMFKVISGWVLTCLLGLYIMAMSKVILGWVLTCLFVGIQHPSNI